MRFFWLPLSIMKCSGEPFTHIWEWKRCSSSSGYSGSYFWIFVVAMVVLGFASIIWFPFSFPLLGSDLESQHASDLEAFISASSDRLAQNSLVFWVELLWNTHHFPLSFFGFVVLFFACGFDRFSWVTMPWLYPLFCGLGAPFPFFWFADPKSRFFYLNFCSILAAYGYVVPSEEMSRNSISSWMYLADNCDTLAPNVSLNVWYLTLYARYGIYF